MPQVPLLWQGGQKEDMAVENNVHNMFVAGRALTWEILEDIREV